MKAEDNERWLTDGDCSKCRRSEHCSKLCTAQKKRKAAVFMQIRQTARGRKAMVTGGAVNGEGVK